MNSLPQQSSPAQEVFLQACCSGHGNGYQPAVMPGACCVSGRMRLQGPRDSEDERNQGRGGSLSHVWQSLERPAGDQPAAAESGAEASAQASQARESAQLLNEVRSQLWQSPYVWPSGPAHLLFHKIFTHSQSPLSHAAGNAACW